MGNNKKTQIGFRFQVSSFRILFFVCVFGFLFFIFDFCQAAILYLEPSSGDYHLGDIFLADIRIDTQGEYINTVEADLSFSQEILGVEALSQGNSILSVWIKEPENKNGVIFFTGGIPGGYQGINGLLLKIAFRANRVSSAEVKFLENSKVLLNDGRGTEANLSFKEARFNILTQEGQGKNLWQEEINKDKTSPQPFKIELSRDLSIFEGKYFIIFSTTDKETGIDHYEVKEGRGGWQVTSSPYVLKNQKLTDDIWVKAADKAGNEWMEVLKAQNKSGKKLVSYIILVFILALVIIGIGWIIRKKSQDKNQNEKL